MMNKVIKMISPINPPENFDVKNTEARLKRRLTSTEAYSLLMYRAFMGNGKSADDMKSAGFEGEYDVASGIMNQAYDTREGLQ